jgi:hypothetical protein
MSGSQKNKHRLTVVKEPQLGTRATLTSNIGGPIFFAGSEEVPDLFCGKCERILVSGGRRERIGDWVLKCPCCGAFNDASPPRDPSSKLPVAASGTEPA